MNYSIKSQSSKDSISAVGCEDQFNPPNSKRINLCRSLIQITRLILVNNLRTFIDLQSYNNDQMINNYQSRKDISVFPLLIKNKYYNQFIYNKNIFSEFQIYIQIKQIFFDQEYNSQEFNSKEYQINCFHIQKLKYIF
ncbi:hypothetical protein pb186bvf_016243 [Paramecium bursaria]